jgi:serine protease
MKKILTALFCSTMLLLACSSAPTDEVEDPSVLHFKDARGSTSGGNLVDHGGKILPTSNTYAIWWGTQSAFPSDAKAGLDSLFGGLAGSSFLGVSSQYMRGGTSTSAFHTNWVDTSAPPGHGPNTATIVGEACTVIVQNGATPDPTGIYFVYTSNFPKGGNYCAWHSHGTCNGVDIKVAYMPNTAGVAGCDPGDLYSCNSYSQGTRSLANVTSHEFMEAITDPDLNAWLDGSGSEIGDKCAWKFSSCVTLTTGSWQLQQEWSNATTGCVQQ